MAIYHASIKSFSRGKGESSIAAAAYRAGIDLTDTSTRAVHRYSQRRGVASFHMLAPKDAPDWCRDARVFWDANEAWESRANARLARELEVSLPSELSPEQREALALELGQMLVDRYQVVVLVAIHQPSDKGDQRNHHVHLLMSARQVGTEGLGARAGTEFDARGGKGAEEIRLVRELVSRTINAHLVSAGVDVTVDHRSLKDQARAAAGEGDYRRAVELSRPPTKHVGRAITAMLRRGVDLDPWKALGVPAIGRAIEEAAARAAATGRLMPSTTGHSHAAALADRQREGRQVGPISTESLPSTPGLDKAQVQPARRALVGGQSGPSAAALRLSRLARIARSQGRDAEVLNVEAQLIEDWLISQAEAAQAALTGLQQIAGIQIEPLMTRAVDLVMQRRVQVYGTAPLFFEESEALTQAIVTYATELRQPHEMRLKLERARALLSEEERSDTSRRSSGVLRARRVLRRAKANVSLSARLLNDKRVSEARTALRDACNLVERKFHLTTLMPVYVELPVEDAESTAEAATKSESNQRELKPRPRPRV